MTKLPVLLIFLAVFLPTTIFASSNAEILDKINNKVCSRFEEDVNKLAAIMDELKRRKGITETRVAFGGVDTPIKRADYWITYASEAIAYQRVQNYPSKSQLKNSLEVLKGKILRAKNEVKKTLENEQ